MLQKLLSVAGVSSLLISSALGAARAADMPLKAPPLAPVPYSWTGFYIGGLLGGGFGDNHSSYSGFDPGDTPPSVSPNGSGVVAGAEAGYNRQFGTWLAGLEADVAYTHIDGTASSVSVNGVTQPTEQDLNWLATVRGRLGVLPSERLLLFATGGAAFGGISLSSRLGPASGACGPGNSCGSGSTSATHAGWTLGGGIEYAVSDWVSLKAEYLYVDLGSISLTYPITLAVSQSTTNAQFRDSIVRAGLNIRLGPQH
jgi:outer membrane immunogenic protein